ncbi:uncharacterized protein MELLADRAFT_123557 [Melampsora larici-populina 98AG31]|uniref:Secreted protein n=1 Tax=Melampsora larici-populina (strain 98AG31 / pathotype 3-4-7) TaxID=747676 RepID=F4R9N3_MELLP|nr:uncharacterized protein MELLADRAFT_123557 [Melampsora larici-populina 98AG31]EGG11119.1 secreted protein [Melampsora larici-populina 98AG31]
MSWIRSIPIFHLLLVCLLAGDLGFHIFADANAIDCSHACETQGSGSSYVTNYCTNCRRGDRLLPSGKDCVDQSGKLMNGGDLWACDIVFEPFTEYRKDGRQFYCNQSERTGLFFCKTMNKFLQCPKSQCSTTP